MTETRTQAPADQPVKFELMATDEDSPFQLESRSEIQFLLNSMAKSGDLITAFFNQGNDFLLTALLRVDDSGVILDYGASERDEPQGRVSRRS